MAYQFRNLVFEGGGVKGIAYVGALEVLQQKGILPQIQRIGGTSAGAINAILLGLGFSQAETQDLLWSLDFNRFMDGSWGLLRDLQRLTQDYGWYKGDYFRQWIAGLIQQKTGNGEATFADLEAMKSSKGFKSLYFMGTNLSTGYAEVFSAEHSPRMTVADAVRISMSIPLFFAARRSVRGDVYVDGGVLNNYPIKLFDREKYTDAGCGRDTDYYQRVNARCAALPRPVSRYLYNKQTLGFRLDSAAELAVFRDHAEAPRRSIDDFFDYSWALMHCLMEAQQNNHLHSDDWQRTIYIDSLNVATTDFALSEQRKRDLVLSGQHHTEKYFDWYDSAQGIANK